MPAPSKTNFVEESAAANGWDHGSNPDFFNYYAAESQSDSTRRRFLGIQAAVLRIAAQTGLTGQLDVVDIGCGAGTQSRLWSRLGHRVRGLDVNEPLIELARQRAASEGLDIRFEVGSATELPWRDASFDVCLLPELLEHVADWQCCLREAARVLRRGGLLYVSTTNFLCPVQAEFNLTAYSWYPRRIKRYYERLAVTTRPEIANHAKYPAVHWFSFYTLRDFLVPLGFRCLDRFDLIDLRAHTSVAHLLVRVIRAFRAARLLAHVATPGTYLIAVKCQASG
jgi:2-polyprenyl-6-hydroxyphenyl methylase/3-demethylubiquinone-9 3-methyltransferase